MIQGLKVANFRSIESCDVALSPMTVLYGPTASGKSTLLYALLTLRNFVLTPNQALDGLFNIGFQNLGGFEACVFNHDTVREVSIEARYSKGKAEGAYGVRLGKTGGAISLSAAGIEMKMGISIPYGLGTTQKSELAEGNGDEYTVQWNGITSTVAPNAPTAENQATALKLAIILNASVETLRRTDLAPHRRGFFKPSYNVTPISPLPTSEDEVASLLINDMHLPPRISSCTEEIFGRDFRTHTPPGTAITYLQTTDKKARLPVLLVNDGFGVNQVVYILAKAQRLDVDTLLIEEPEVHRHPSVVRNFARVLCSLVTDDQKQVILTTHSEQFLLSLLVCIREKRIRATDVRCFHVTRDKRTSVFEQQAVTEAGQIEGGLRSFLEAEVEDLKSLLSIG